MNRLQWSEQETLFRLFPLVISISFAMDVFVPAIPQMSNYFHQSSATMQASLYLFMLTVAIGQLLIGPAADRYGRRRIALITAGLFFIGSTLSALAHSISALLLGRIIQAIGACGTYLICFIVIRDNFSTQACGRLFSQLNGFNAMIASTAPVIGGVLLDITHNWRSGFYFLSVLAAIICYAGFKNIPSYPAPHQTKTSSNLWKDVTNILNNHNFQQYCIIASAALLGLYLFCALSPEILITNLHISGTQYGLWFGLNAITVFVTNLIAARLTHYLQLEKIVSIGVVIMMAACLLMVVCNYNQTSVLSFMLPMLSLTVGIGISMGCAAALSSKDFDNLAGLATSMLSACQFAIAGAFGTVVANLSLTPTSLALSVLLMSVIGSVLVMVRNVNATSEHEQVT